MKRLSLKGKHDVEQLNKIRKRLDKIDTELVELLAKRKAAISEVIQQKVGENLALRDKNREAELIANRIREGQAQGLDSYFVTRIFHEIIDYSLRIQQDVLLERGNRDTQTDRMVITFQGIEGAFSHLAGMKFFSTKLDRSTFRGERTFRAMLALVEEGTADYAMLPIENTTAGSINESYDLLRQTKLSIIGEEIFPIQHCLMAIDDIPLSRLRRIFSHPVALEQCTEFLATLDQCSVEPFIDTAMAIKKVKDDQDPLAAAIGSHEAGELYGLTILREGIANNRQNYTRFFVVGRKPVDVDLRIPCKTSIIVTTKHVEGALVNCLNVLARHHLSLTKLESRPQPNVPWEYLFYIDFEGNIASEGVKVALEELASEVSFLKILGSYPAKTVAGAQPVDQQSITKKAANIPTPRQSDGTRLESVRDELEKKPYKLASRLTHPQDTKIRVGTLVIGGADFVVFAGPCSVESAMQIQQCAKAVKDLGGDVLRGGVFKPRTSPYSFQGLGLEGLSLLVAAGREVGLPTITEVTHPRELEPVTREADIIQIGARNMQNFALLREVGQVNKPVFLKRGMMASIDELLAAAEYILSQGNQQVMLCERGIRTFETATRNTLDISAVPILRARTHLPIIVDPSHACGDWRWVEPLAEAALVAGAHGVMVEIHPDPAHAISDGPQSLNFEKFGQLMRRIRRLQKALAAS